MDYSLVKMKFYGNGGHSDFKLSVYAQHKDIYTFRSPWFFKACPSVQRSNRSHYGDPIGTYHGAAFIWLRTRQNPPRPSCPEGSLPTTEYCKRELVATLATVTIENEKR